MHSEKKYVTDSFFLDGISIRYLCGKSNDFWYTYGRIIITLIITIIIIIILIIIKRGGSGRRYNDNDFDNISNS